MTGRKAEADHVLLGIAVSFTEFLDPNTKGTKELLFINHPLYLENPVTNHHEQNSLEGRMWSVPQRSYQSRCPILRCGRSKTAAGVGRPLTN